MPVVLGSLLNHVRHDPANINWRATRGVHILKADPLNHLVGLLDLSFEQCNNPIGGFTGLYSPVGVRIISSPREVMLLATDDSRKPPAIHEGHVFHNPQQA